MQGTAYNITGWHKDVPQVPHSILKYQTHLCSLKFTHKKHRGARMSYQDGFLDALIMFRRWLEECKDFECLREKIEYYLGLASDKKLERIRYELQALK